MSIVIHTQLFAYDIYIYIMYNIYLYIMYTIYILYYM